MVTCFECGKHGWFRDSNGKVYPFHAACYMKQYFDIYQDAFNFTIEERNSLFRKFVETGEVYCGAVLKDI